MRKIVEEVDGEGLHALLGKYVALWCINYIYSGKLIGVNDTDVLLGDAKVVYETGWLTDKEFYNAQSLPGDWYVRVSAIESYGEFHA